MPKSEVREIWRCEFCKKHYLSERACVKHEPYCSKKPENDHKCYHDCSHLDRGVDDGQTYFHCKKKCLDMYGYGAERSDYLREHVIGDLERMPIECEDYECGCIYCTWDSPLESTMKSKCKNSDVVA